MELEKVVEKAVEKVGDAPAAAPEQPPTIVLEDVVQQMAPANGPTARGSAGEVKLGAAADTAVRTTPQPVPLSAQVSSQGIGARGVGRCSSLSARD